MHVNERNSSSCVALSSSCLSFQVNWTCSGGSQHVICIRPHPPGSAAGRPRDQDQVWRGRQKPHPDTPCLSYMLTLTPQTTPGLIGSPMAVPLVVFGTDQRSILNPNTTCLGLALPPQTPQHMGHDPLDCQSGLPSKRPGVVDWGSVWGGSPMAVPDRSCLGYKPD